MHAVAHKMNLKVMYRPFIITNGLHYSVFTFMKGGSNNYNAEKVIPLTNIIKDICYSEEGLLSKVITQRDELLLKTSKSSHVQHEIRARGLGREVRTANIPIKTE